MILLTTPYRRGEDQCTHLAITLLTIRPLGTPSVTVRTEYGNVVDGTFVPCGDRPQTIRVEDITQEVDSGIDPDTGEAVQVEVRAATTDFTDLVADYSPARLSAWLISSGYYAGTVV